jgi:hypothetical protein
LPPESDGGRPPDAGEGPGNENDRILRCGFHWKCADNDWSC